MYKTKQNAMCKLAENWYLCTSLPKSTKEKKNKTVFSVCIRESQWKRNLRFKNKRTKNLIFTRNSTHFNSFQPNILALGLNNNPIFLFFRFFFRKLKLPDLCVLENEFKKLNVYICFMTMLLMN